MTVSSETAKSGPYTGNGVTTVFAYGFRILDAGHIEVIRTVAGTNTTVSPSDYTVSGVGDLAGGNVTFAVAPLAGQTITIIRNAPFTQQTDLENQGAYYAETIEEALDLAAMRDQQMAEELTRAVKLPVGEDPAVLNSLVEDIIRLADSADEIDTVAGIEAEVVTVAGLTAEIAALPGQLSSAQAAAAAAEAALDSFDDRYLGAKAVAPTVDNDGNALLVGAVYWDSVSNQMFTWSGAEWRPTFLTGNAVRQLTTATGGQTVVTVPTYLVGANTIQVYLNGLKVMVSADYTETNQNTITFLSALTLGDEVEVIVLQPYAIGTTGAESITTIYGVTLARLIELREGTVAEFFADTTLNPLVVPVGSVIEAGGFRYEVVASGEHRATAGGLKLNVLTSNAGQYFEVAFGGDITKAFEVAARAKRPLVLQGAYTVTGPLLNIFSGDAELHLHCLGDVRITVDPAAAFIRDLIICQTDTVSSHSVTGGSLTIVGNDKIGSGLTVRHVASADGGTVNFAAPVTVTGCSKEAAGSYENWGIGVLGRMTRIVMSSPRAENVTRQSVAGACSGIVVSGFVGDVEIRGPVVRRIFTGSGTADADGIKSSGFARNGLTAKRDGRVRIYGLYAEDCSGRAYKSQCSDDIVYHPVVKRSASVAVGIAQGVDFDFQCGNGRLIGPRVEYYADGVTSPLGASHSVAAFQQLVTDEEMLGRMENLTVISDVAIPRIALGVHAAGTARSVTEIDGVNLIPANGFSGTMLSRAVLEFGADSVVAKTERTRLSVRNVVGPNTWAVIGYTGYDGSSPLTSKLSWDVTDCTSPLSPTGAGTRPFTNLSGSAILAVEQSRQFGLTGYRTLYTGAHVVDFRALTAGTVLTVDIATVAATNPPPWGVSGFAHIRCEGGYFGANDRTVWVVKDNATNVWFTLNGGTTWGVVK